MTTLYRATVWHMTSNPLGISDAERCFESLDDGALVVEDDGKIADVGDYPATIKRWPKAKVIDLTGRILIPGFVDVHVHFPQLDMIGAYGEDLLGWLDKYTFPQEENFRDAAHAAAVAPRFFTELLANGTTTAAVFSSSHEAATDILFTEADKRGLRIIAGKVSMDRHAPASLLTKADAESEITERLIKKWHGKAGRLFYALTPRFAPSCSATLLKTIGKLRQAFPTVYVQTHHAESPEEIKWVKELFPKCGDYLQVYEDYDLTGEKTILAHCIHPTGSEIKRLASQGIKVAHCPTSNLFLGSGLFPMQRLLEARVAFALGTDIGGGTSLSIWKTMAEAYKVQQLQKTRVALTGPQLFYLATLGGAKVLSLDEQIGNFEKNKWADFQVIDWQKNRLLATRFQNTNMSAAEKLFALIFHGDDRLTEKVYLSGKLAYSSK